jgi:N-acetylmuramoyl-L-alanine amidase
VTSDFWLARLLTLALTTLGAVLIVSCAGFQGGAVAEIRDVGLAPLIRDQVIEDTGGADAPGALNLMAAPEPETVILDPVTGFPSFPLPDGNPEPLGPAVFNSGFRDPLPRSPVWNPAGTKRVGLQVGHWNTNDLPYELRRLSPGSTAGGWTEAELNLLLARTAARYLEEAGIEVDILPTTIPVRYRAHAFVSIHADGDTSGRLNGYKIARPSISSIPDADDEFVRIMYDEYGAATGMARDSDAHISRRMTYYYAFNTRRYQHAIDLGTPSQIIETGFLTNAGDRSFLTGRSDLAGRGIANGILRFLALEMGRTG